MSISIVCYFGFGCGIRSKNNVVAVFWVKIFDKNAEMSEFGYLSDGQ